MRKAVNIAPWKNEHWTVFSADTFHHRGTVWHFGNFSIILSISSCFYSNFSKVCSNLWWMWFFPEKKEMNLKKKIMKNKNITKKSQEESIFKNGNTNSKLLPLISFRGRNFVLLDLHFTNFSNSILKCFTMTFLPKDMKIGNHFRMVTIKQFKNKNRFFSVNSWNCEFIKPYAHTVLLGFKKPQ